MARSRSPAARWPRPSSAPVPLLEVLPIADGASGVSILNASEEEVCIKVTLTYEVALSPSSKVFINPCTLSHEGLEEFGGSDLPAVEIFGEPIGPEVEEAESWHYFCEDGFAELVCHARIVGNTSTPKRVLPKPKRLAAANNNSWSSPQHEAPAPETPVASLPNRVIAPRSQSTTASARRAGWDRQASAMPESSHESWEAGWCIFGAQCRRADCTRKHLDSSSSVTTSNDGSNVLFVGRLPKVHPVVDENVLYEYFSQFGCVMSARVKEDMQGRSRGFGFVVFAEARGAEAAVASGHPEWDVKRKKDMN